jgi:hypothetical protein
LWDRHESAGVFRRLRENGPVVLVPAAWTVAAAAHADVIDRHTLLVAHVVMDVVLVAFATLSWSDMQSGVLGAWLAVLVAGIPFTLLGTYGLFEPPVAEAVVAPTVYAWMLIPAAGLAYTGQAVEAGEGPWVYLVGAALSVLGAFVYVAGGSLPVVPSPTLLGLALVGLGQTAGIANAVYQY